MATRLLLMNLAVVAIVLAVAVVAKQLPFLFLFGILIGVAYCCTVAYLEYGVVLGRKWMQGEAYKGPLPNAEPRTRVPDRPRTR